jgi:deoxyribose-phosphate aldolase
MEITKKNVAGIIDHTLLKQNASEKQIEKICQEQWNISLLRYA